MSVLLSERLNDFGHSQAKWRPHRGSCTAVAYYLAQLSSEWIIAWPALTFHLSITAVCRLQPTRVSLAAAAAASAAGKMLVRDSDASCLHQHAGPVCLLHDLKLNVFVFIYTSNAQQLRCFQSAIIYRVASLRQGIS